MQDLKDAQQPPLSQMFLNLVFTRRVSLKGHEGSQKCLYVSLNMKD